MLLTPADSSDVDVRTLDWRDAADGQVPSWLRDEPPELILGADVSYDPDLTPMLSSCLAAILLLPRPSSSPAPIALLSATIRQQNTWTAFLDQCRA